MDNKSQVRLQELGRTGTQAKDRIGGWGDMSRKASRARDHDYLFEVRPDSSRVTVARLPKGEKTETWKNLERRQKTCCIRDESMCGEGDGGGRLVCRYGEKRAEARKQTNIKKAENEQASKTSRTGYHVPSKAAWTLLLRVPDRTAMADAEPGPPAGPWEAVDGGLVPLIVSLSACVSCPFRRPFPSPLA